MAEVAVFSGANYQGKSVALAPGHHQLNPELDNTISSVRVSQGW